MESIRITEGNILQVDLSTIENRIKEQEALIVTTLDCYEYGPDDSRGLMKFWLEYSRLNIQTDRMFVKKFSMMKASKDKPLCHNTIKAMRVCDNIIKFNHTQALDLCSDAVIAGYVEEQWYLNKAMHFKVVLEIMAEEDRLFYK
jgi:hypothetical protein